MLFERNRICHQRAQVWQVQMCGKITKHTIGTQLINDDEKNVFGSGQCAFPFLMSPEPIAPRCTFRTISLLDAIAKQKEEFDYKGVFWRRCG